MYVVHEVDELEEELPAPSSLLPWSDTVDESVGINAEGTVDNDLNLNGGDTNHNESKSDLLSTDSNVDDIPVKMIQMPMKNWDPLGLKGETKEILILGRKKIGRQKQ